jgi:DNA-directed RNA polymerase subunit RPC12/RpoP
LILAAALRCPACGRRFLVERHGQRHPHARWVPPFSFCGTVISDVVRRGEFTCMYCAGRCRVHRDVN